MSKTSPSPPARYKKKKNKTFNYTSLVFLKCKNTNKSCITFTNFPQLLPTFVYLPIFTPTILNHVKMMNVGYSC